MSVRKCATVLMIVGACLLLAAPVTADWNEGDFYKWVQRPDPDGWDVHFTTEPHILADDFLCTQTMRITDIHFWYSWSEDYVGDITKVHASIHADIPDPDGAGPLFSMPGDELWSKDFIPGVDNVTFRPDGTGDQGFYSPRDDSFTPHDHLGIWQANIFIDPADAFEQLGTPDKPIVYWLDLYVETDLGLAGWKTSLDHWNDDAVYWDEGKWNELIDPETGESLDLAFVITPEPSTVVMLLGAGLIGLLAFVRRWRKK